MTPIHIGSPEDIDGTLNPQCRLCWGSHFFCWGDPNLYHFAHFWKKLGLRVVIERLARGDRRLWIGRRFCA